MRGVARAFRTIARPRWKQWVLLVLVSGSLAGAAIAAGTAARRTSTAFPRMLVESRLANADVAGDQSTHSVASGARYLDAVERLPQVGSVTREGGVELLQVSPDGTIDPRLALTDTATAFIPSDTTLFRTTERLRLLRGRLPNPDRPAEMAINPEMASLMGWHIGSRPTGLAIFPTSSSDRRGNPIADKGVPVDLTVVGIVRYPTELLFDTDSRVPRAFLSYAFGVAHPTSTFYSVDLIHLAPGASITTFRSEVAGVAQQHHGQFVSVVSTVEGAAAAAQALRPQQAALWALCGIGLLVAIGLLAQGLAANLNEALPTFQVLRSIGFGRRSRRGIGLLAGTVTSVATAAIAVGVATAMSPLGPISAARAAEPHPGVEINLAMLALGAAVLIIASIALAAVPSVRVAAASEGRLNRGEDTTPVRLATRLAQRGARVSAVVGVGMAFQRDRRGGGVSSRAALAGVCAAVTLATGSLVFVSNLSRLTTTPHLYGWNWDVAAGTNFGTIPTPAVPRVIGLPYVEQASATTFGAARIGRTIVPGVGITGLTDTSPFPTIRTGRRPATPNEVVVGSRTLDDIRAKVGDTVSATIDGTSRPLRIVGTATFPELGPTRFQTTDLGKGIAGMANLFPQDPTSGGTYNYVLMTLAPGGLSKLTVFLGKLGCAGDTCIITDGRPTELNGYAKARTLARTGVGILALALLLALSRAVITSVGRRRRSFAVLKAMGMTRRQITSTVVWQSTTVAVTSLIIGIPLGIVLGRVSWSIFANDLGVEPLAHLSVAVILLAVLSVVAAALLVAIVGAARARRTRTARELRAA